MMPSPARGLKDVPDKGYGVPSERVRQLDLPMEALSSAERDELLTALQNNKRSHMEVDVKTTMCFQRFLNAGMMSKEEMAEMKALQGTIYDKLKLDRPANVLFVNATELGGGVAEMRLDTIALFRDLKISAKWLVIDGADPFYKVTVHMHEGIQNPGYAPMTGKEVDTFHLTNIQNFLRMEQAHPLNEVDIVWIDDPQPLGTGLLVKTLYPQTLVLWRCHVHVDAEQSIKSLVKDLVTGTLDSERDGVLLEFLSKRGHPGVTRSYDAFVFHKQAFADNLGLGDSGKVFNMLPCINPLSFKNMTITDSLIEATLVKYGIMGPRIGRDAKVPPIVLEVSRYDPYKGPLELITAFTEAARLLPESLQLEIVLVLVSSLPGDNPSGIRMARILQEFVDSLDLSGLPQSCQAGGKRDLRKRIFLLMLDDKAPWERLVDRLCEDSGFDKDRISGIAREVQELAELPITDAVDHLDYCGLIDSDLAKKLVRDPLPTGVTCTVQQKAALLQVLSETRKRKHPGGTAVTKHRAERGCFTGKELNAFEVNALQSAALLNVQFSSKEGFGLTVSEALVKSLPGYEGPMAVTLVGGIRPQAEVCECLTIEYPADEIAASLATYRQLPDHPDEAFLRGLFKEVLARASVQQLVSHIVKGCTMPDEERVRMSAAARTGVLHNFSTWVNIHNILKAMALAAKHLA